MKNGLLNWVLNRVDDDLGRGLLVGVEAILISPQGYIDLPSLYRRRDIKKIVLSPSDDHFIMFPL